MSDWTTVGQRDQVEADAPLGVAVGETKIGIYEVDGQLHAVEDVCPHAAALLTQGFADGCEVECPLHNAVFDVTTGKYLRGEPCRDLKTYPVRLAGTEIQVQVISA
ncbi:MAG: non-heme iron oxygenase ferredoxin subunit [Burkholderiales bacterium]